MALMSGSYVEGRYERRYATRIGSARRRAPIGLAGALDAGGR